MMIQIDEKDPAVQQYRAALAKYQELQTAKRALDRQIDETLEQLAKFSQSSDSLTLEAQAMLSGSTLINQQSLREEIEKLTHKRDVVRAGCDIQKRTLDRARGIYSKKLNDLAEPLHDQVVLRIAKAVRELAAAADEETRIFDELVAADASVRLRPMRISAIGSARDEQSRANLFLKEIADFFPHVFRQLQREGLIATNRNAIVVFTED